MKVYIPQFRIFRSESSRRFFAVHQVDNEEKSIVVMKDKLSFEEASELVLQLREIKDVIAVGNEIPANDVIKSQTLPT